MSGDKANAIAGMEEAVLHDFEIQLLTTRRSGAEGLNCRHICHEMGTGHDRDCAPAAIDRAGTPSMLSIGLQDELLHVGLAYVSQPGHSGGAACARLEIGCDLPLAAAHV